jgi:hypothetical protein
LVVPNPVIVTPAIFRGDRMLGIANGNNLHPEFGTVPKPGC